ncbi:site-2 protease family protein [Longimicrobium sp.]|uniref:site-2 protease family protein n=1 Tax=Longimicrobium sp. TaxID=2029185 RepID=UPI002E3233A8|nr:site-2 protease family protein [Longimicrobium sp.]HEX6041604.1 site-2 protease family protein [Longimicrobium sp.]
MNFDLTAVLLALPVLLLSLTAHEWGHAWVALKQGDDTAYMLGRVTMNPAAHVDVVGTLLFPAIAIGSGLPLLGWAKPVPTNPRKYRNYRRGDILVSIAGVCMNAVLAVVFAVLLFWITQLSQPGQLSGPVQSLAQMCLYGVVGNVGLIVFNLLPIPPLDGSHVFYHLLPAAWGAEYRKLYPYGFLILWALVLTRALTFLFPAIRAMANVLLTPSGMRL